MLGWSGPLHLHTLALRVHFRVHLRRQELSLLVNLFKRWRFYVFGAAICAIHGHLLIALLDRGNLTCLGCAHNRRVNLIVVKSHEFVVQLLD